MEIYKTKFKYKSIVISQIIMVLMVIYLLITEKDLDIGFVSCIYLFFSFIGYSVTQNVNIIITIYKNRIRIHYPWSLYLKPVELEFENITSMIVRDRDSRGYLNRLIFNLKNSKNQRKLNLVSIIKKFKR